ncbi:MAG: methyltransferase, partial [Planctomycetes bacterium]|nr:methyltransferase [Planctomycetota bacterium]
RKTHDDVGDELESGHLPVRTHEQLLIDVIPEVIGERVVCTTAGRAQFAEAYARGRPSSHVACLFLDLYQKNQSEFQVFDNGPASNLRLLCKSDLPEGECDLVAFPFRKGGDAELTRDLLQQGHLRLAIGGRMIVSTDNDEDQWLHEQLQSLFPKVTRRPVKKIGTVYLATKTQPLRREKPYDCEYAFRDQGRLIRVFSRPGVFSHRRIDLGARTLINTMVIETGMRVLDMGCGVGTVSLAAALRAEKVSVMALDSNPRAIECTQRNAELNEVPNITAILDCEGASASTGDFDLVLANPPYFSNFAIAELFLDTAYRALKRGGLVQVVTKTPNWFVERMPLWFVEIQSIQAKDYWIVSGRMPRR